MVDEGTHSITDPKVIEPTPDQAAKLDSVTAFMIEEYDRVGYVQRDEDATEDHRQRLLPLEYGGPVH